MARSTRSVSRGVSPSLPTEKTTRATRSRSADLGNGDAAAVGRQTRSSQQPSVERAATKSNKRGKATRAPKVNKELSIVEEGDVEEEEDPVQERESGPSKSMPTIAEASHLSGTTALDTDRDEMSADIIVEELVPLDEYSTEIIKQLTRDDVVKIEKDLEDPRSKLSRRMRDRMAHLEISKANFGNGVYIDEDLVLRKLFGYQYEEVDLDGTGRPDHILCKANIAVTMYTLVAKKGGDPGLIEFMTNLDETFPSPFFASDIPEDQLLGLALDLRTQLLILHLQALQGSDNFDPDAVIARIFYHGGEEMTTEQILEGGHPKSIAGLTPSVTVSNTIAAVINKIRGAIMDNSQAHKTKEFMDMDDLRSRFSWVDFLSRLFNFLESGARECQAHIDRQGGVRKMAEILEADQDDEVSLNKNVSSAAAQTSEAVYNTVVESEAEKRRRLKAAAAVIYQPPTRSSPRISKQTKSKAEMSGGQQSAVAGPSKPRSVAQGQSSRAGQSAQSNDEPTVHGADDNETADISSMPDFVNIQATYDAMQMEKNKENKKPRKRLIDPQPGATKATWDDDDTQADERSKSRSKRTRKDAEIEDDDEMFVSEQPSPNSRSPKRPRTQPANSQQQGVNPESHRNSREKSRTGEDGDVEEQEDEAPVPSQSYQEINAVARRQVAMKKSVVAQSRVPWTVAECEALVELIADHGNGYAAISKSEEAAEAIQERHRDQVALKDKARNIKMDYLLAGLPLPKNFNEVKLGRKERDRIIKAGLNPFRREGEEVGEESHDENGVPYE